MARIHRRTVQKDLHDPDNHDGVIIHVDLDHIDIHILECEVKWALGSITMNKASGDDGIPVELFTDDAVKEWVSIMPTNLESSAVDTGLEKGQFSFQFQRKTMPKNAQTTPQLHSSHTLAK